jgi:Ca2+-transporting ATPase
MMSFVTLVIGNLGLIFTNRSLTRSILATLRIPNPALWWVTAGTLFFLGLAVLVPFLRGLFSFDPLHLWEIGLIGTAGLLSILISESVKLHLFSKGS